MFDKVKGEEQSHSPQHGKLYTYVFDVELRVVHT
jgi:hypothetical protein